MTNGSLAAFLKRFRTSFLSRRDERTQPGVLTPGPHQNESRSNEAEEDGAEEAW
jgi:hypothetical protein